MDALIKERISKEAFVDESELARITRHLAEIDPTLTPYAKTLASPPYKDLSDPEAFSRRTQILEPADLVAVHLTDTFPVGGIIHPLVYYDPNILRYSIHFTINSTVEDVNFYGAQWSWKEKKYAILIPFDKIQTRLAEYNPGETIIIDDLQLPENTVILTSENSEVPQSSGKLQIAHADYSRNGAELNGFHRAVYETIIRMGYFPQLAHPNYGWYTGLWGQYRNVHADFCKRNGLMMGTGHIHHWSERLESFSTNLARISQANDQEQFRDAVVEAREYFLEGKDWYAPYIPTKYKQALMGLLHKYGKQFPDVVLT